MAANDFLLRQNSDETFATAVHVLVDLEQGRLPADQRRTSARPGLVPLGWLLDGGRGPRTALGITHQTELHMTKGRLCPGDALLFHTMVLLQTRHTDLDEGVPSAPAPGHPG